MQQGALFVPGSEAEKVWYWYSVLLYKFRTFGTVPVQYVMVYARVHQGGCEGHSSSMRASNEANKGANELIKRSFLSFSRIPQRRAAWEDYRIVSVVIGS